MFNSPGIQRLIAQLNHPERKQQKHAASVLLQLGQPAVKYLVQAIESEHEDTALSAAAVLVQMGPAAIDPLADCLRAQPSLICQRLVIQILSQIGDRSASAALREMLRSQEDHPLSDLIVDTLFNIEARHLQTARQ